MKINSYRDLIVWKKSVTLVKEVYLLTSLFPKSELFGVVSQIRRASISIPSNIAEGYGRRSNKEYLQFFSIAYGSALELETQLIISQELNLAKASSFEKVSILLTEVVKMLYVMTYKKEVYDNVKRVDDRN